MSRQSFSYEQLAAFAAGELSVAEVSAIREYLAADAAAASTVARLQLLLTTLRTDDSQAPPADMLERAKALFRERKQVLPGESWFDAIKQVVAELVYDSRPRLALAGVRGGSGSYQLSFESDLADIDLDVEPLGEPDADQRRLIGQVSPRSDEAATKVVLARPGTTAPVHIVEPDESGMFKLTTERGKFDVLVSLPEGLVVLPAVEIQ